MNDQIKEMKVPSSVVMVRPHHFKPNPQTAGDNSFQICEYSLANAEKENSTSVNKHLIESEQQIKAYNEATFVADELSKRGVDVHLFEDDSIDTPDSVFPNNWFSTHSNGMIGLYPMYSENRRKERRTDVIERLQSHYHVTQIIDYSDYEHRGMFLEGTGAMVLDHINRIAYGSISHRLDQKLFQLFCDDFGYSPILFQAANNKNIPVYHTNVLMSVSENFSLIGLSMIKCIKEREKVRNTLIESGKEVIELSENQIRQFAGNMLELSNGRQRMLVMSETAFNGLTKEQMVAVQQHTSIEVFSIPTIEKAGGSIRCMLADIHLTRR